MYTEKDGAPVGDKRPRVLAASTLFSRCFQTQFVNAVRLPRRGEVSTDADRRGAGPVAAEALEGPRDDPAVGYGSVVA